VYFVGLALSVKYVFEMLLRVEMMFVLVYGT